MAICIAGLGNPGAKYERTRHNIGFRAIDRLAQDWSIPCEKEKSGGLFGRGYAGDKEVYLIKPMKFMNLSGQVLVPFMQYFKIEPTALIVIHDEIELPFAEVRSKFGGGHKGHNGLRNIMAGLGKGKDFWRLRAGVDRPQGKDVAGYVLSPFSSAEENDMPVFLDELVRGCNDILDRIK